MENVTISAFGMLKVYLPTELTVAPNQTVGQAVESLQLGTNEAIISVVNGRVVGWNYELKAGDRLELVQGIGGG